MILFNSPANPTGVTATPAEIEGMAELAAEHNIAAGQRRDLQPVLLRRAVRVAGPASTRDAGDRRLFQDLRHDRLAVGLCPRAGAKSSSR